MSISPRAVVPLSQARATLSDLADHARAGAEKIITKNGASRFALIRRGPRRGTETDRSSHRESGA